MKNNLIISYDLMKHGQDYEAVITEIKSLGSWARLNQSVWYVKSAYSAEQAMNRLSDAVDYNDKIIVIDASNNDWAAFNMADNVGDFLDRHWSK